MQLAKNFPLSEFQSKDGAPFPDEVLPQLQELAENLQIIRDHIGMPLSVNSGYRSPEHNKAIGGKPNSYHKKGMAADLSCDLEPFQLYQEIEKLMLAGKIKKGGLVEYKTFVHYDIRGWFANW